jgi:hypothetical protein
MSRLPHQPVPDDAIDVEIPVLTVEADALESGTTSPIAELSTLSVEALFDKTVLGPVCSAPAGQTNLGPQMGI